MSFVLQRVTDRGLVLNQVGADALRIGRGTNAELRSENPAVALEHAVIAADAAGYFITDSGSITGTYVNRKPVETARLAKGDVIEIGDLRIEVQLADPARPMFLRVVSTVRSTTRSAAIDDDDEEIGLPHAAGGAVRAPKIDYADAYKLRRIFLTKASLIALVAIASLVVVGEITTPGKQTLFMPGGVSSAHSRVPEIATNCNACHDPWKGVIDQRCTECHTKAPHAMTQSAAPPCVSCHAEHRGAMKLSQMGDAKCVSCHGDLASHVVKSASIAPSIAHVNAFGANHPDFSWPRDDDSLRFNHKLHLQPAGIFNARGEREKLTCDGCHKLVVTRDKSDPRPIKFATDCQRCHKLTFDIRFPDAEVPHGGDPGLVYAAVVAMSSGGRDFAGKSPDEVRRILSATRSQTTSDERAVVNAEHVIKTKCVVCHDIQKNGTRLAVTPPQLRTRWLETVKFTHTAHNDCERCHAAAHQSARTSDVLMPSRQECVACHGARGGNAASTCVACHEYHAGSRNVLARTAGISPARPSTDPGGGAGMLGTVLLYAIVLLLLVVLIPVGLAIFQRLRVQPDERADGAARRAAGPTAKIPPLAVPPQPAPPPTPAPKPTPAVGTTFVPQNAEPPAGGATELVQWYGMLLCTSGSLEGQRFIVEEDGFYIGRDPSLSAVVINDTRISKRHVRIVPRDGRVHAIDQGSTNGTFLGAAKDQRITDVQLKRGDTIVLADNAATFVYQI
jgi:pSer/pThr/pTyr-binding forkhead associated (FHA) protein